MGSSFYSYNDVGFWISDGDGEIVERYLAETIGIQSLSGALSMSPRLEEWANTMWERSLVSLTGWRHLSLEDLPPEDLGQVKVGLRALIERLERGEIDLSKEALNAVWPPENVVRCDADPVRVIGIAKALLLVLEGKWPLHTADQRNLPYRWLDLLD